MKRVLVTNPIMQRDLPRFEGRLRDAGIETVVHPVSQALDEAQLLRIVPGFDGVIAGDDPFTARVLEAAAPRLKVISKWGVGLDAIDLEAARRLGIQVFNSPGAFADAVAEVAIGYIVMLSRHLHRVDREVRMGKWPKPEGEGLRGKILGIVGLGAIGRAIAQRALPFGMVVRAVDIRRSSPPPGVEWATLDSLLSTADTLCLCCNLTPENRRMIDADRLARMKPTALLVNVARGGLIDEPALIAALAGKRIAGAALDVFEQEPLPPDHPLLALDNVILGSHNANNERRANDFVNRNTIENLLRGLRASE